MHRFREGLAIREPDGDVVETRRAGRRRRAARGLPRVQPDVVVVAAGGDERRLVAHPRLLLEAEDVAPEAERTVEIRDLQMHVADVDARVEHHVAERTLWRWPHDRCDKPHR